MKEFVTVDEMHAKWMKNPKYRREYEALEPEFAFISALIKARAGAGLTQAQLAARMKTTQAAIARLESGGTKPTTRTLEAFAKATGTRLEIRFLTIEPKAVNAVKPISAVKAGKTLTMKRRGVSR